ncbi:MAG TPA: translocation/assembly module TamB domain-containing protein, partial [Elusimicrobiota bacterium]|nr:translocation/assembly module TamB domain-containing protein [Elusimicrobiota bacterium]
EPARGAGPAGVRLPDALVGRLRLSARRAPRRGAPDGFSAEASLELDPYASWYRLGGSLRASASGRLGDVKRARLRHEARLLLDVPRFEDLVSLLAGTPYAVPAPLHVLGGPLALALDSRGDTEGGRQALECRASADLRGGRQRLKLSLRAGAEGDGLPRRDASVRAEGELVVAEAALQLPHLELLKLPVVRLDERIKLARAETPAPAERGQWRDAARDVRRQAALDFRVRTATPAVIYSDLVRTPIPLMVDVQAASPPLAAGTTIEAGRFEAELFRRKCTVDHVRLVRRAGAKTAELDGLLLYKADEAAVRIRLLGTTEKPRVDLESDPPMRRDEILALLLYGKSPNELDPEQTSAVANTQEALSNEALGLLSLFILASTPVESVGYDPATRSYTMRLRLPGGATFELGSDFAESRQGQLRKRIASHFAIEAGVRSSVEQGSAVTTLLEWFGRY